MGWFQDNEKRIRKAIEGFESTAFTYGGALNPKQATEFMRIIRDNSAALGVVRTVQMERLQQDIDKLHIGEPVTRGVDEDVDVAASSDYNRRPLFSRIRLDVTGHKLVSYFPITTEAMQTGIERGRKLEQTIFESAAIKVSDDLENLFWNGNSALPSSTPENLLRRVLDGIGVRSEQSHILDAQAQVISPEIFAAAIKAMPKHYLSRTDMMWWMSTTTAIDWQSVLTQRMTIGGDKALEGWVAMPYGIPIFKKSNDGMTRFGVPHIPDDLEISVSGETAGEVTGWMQGPFQIDLPNPPAVPADNNVARLLVDGNPVQVTFPAGVWHASQIAERFNDILVSTYDASYAYVARTDGLGHLRFVSPTVGAGSSIEIAVTDPGGVNGAWDIFGFTVHNYPGEIDGEGTVEEGSYMLLTPAANMLWGLYTGEAGGRGKDGLRVYTDFRPERDTMRLFIYTQPDVKIENIDAMVRVEQIRRAALV